jgi:cytochrome b6
MSAVTSWLDQRYKFSDFMEFLRHKEVPLGHHSMVWYYLGGTTMFFFAVQILSGLLLLAYYQPGENTAYESIRFITTKVPFGWLIRSVHVWSAHLMILSLCVHMFSTLLLKAYRPPRELTWVTGFVLFSIGLGFGFSGYLLPWNELAYFATAVGTDSVKSVPVIGHWLLEVMRGGPDVTIHTLYRFFALHVVVLPLAIFAIVGMHLLFIQRQGMAPPMGDHEVRRGMPFFPNFLLRDLLLWLICLITLMILAVFLPYGPGIPGIEWELGAKADPLQPAYPGIKPEWYFLWIYQLLKEFPPHLLGMEGPQAALALVSVLMLVWVAIPWLDRNARKDRPSPGFSDYGVAAIVWLTYLTLKAWDVGGHVLGADGQPDPAAVARTSAWWTLGLTALIVVFRYFRFGHRWMLFTGAVALQTVLHGLFGLGYLIAGVIALVAALPAYALLYRGRVMASVIVLAALIGTSTAAQAQHAAEDALPAPEVDLTGVDEGVAEFFEERNDDGQPVIGLDRQAYYLELPSHARELFASAVEEGLISSASHAGALLGLDLEAERFELLVADNCILCHSDEDMQLESTWMRIGEADDYGPAHLSLDDFIGDTHFRRGLSCSGCHGGHPTDTDMADEIYERWPDMDTRHEDRTWIPQFCGRCHSDPVFMRRYNPSLPTDQVAKYAASRHGSLLGEGDSKAAQCVSCHGTHGIRNSQSRLSMVHPQNIPATCARCHGDSDYMAGYTLADGRPIPTNQFENYQQSVHGRALLERGDLGAPACNDCHGNHAAMPPEVSHVSQVCRTCHAGNGTAFDGSKHKAAFEANGWPECEQCHGKHDISPTSDEMLGTAPGELCYDCHDQYAAGKKEACIETAEHFRSTINDLETGYEDFEHQFERLAERGLDIESLEQATADLHDALRATRSAVHTFERSDFDNVADAGVAAIAVGRASIASAEDEFQYRRRGLIISIGVLGFLAVILALKIRQVERRG